MACPVLRERSPAVDAREGTETAHFPAKIRYTTPRDAISGEPELSLEDLLVRPQQRQPVHQVQPSNPWNKAVPTHPLSLSVYRI